MADPGNFYFSDFLMSSVVKPQMDLLQPSLKGSFICRKKCYLCQHLLLESNVVKDFVTRKCCKITQAISWTTKNVIHAVSCEKCKLQHVGFISRQLKVRFRNHKTAMNTKKKTCEMAVHFNVTLQNIIVIITFCQQRESLYRVSQKNENY